MRHFFWLLVVLALAGCGQQTPPSQPATPTADIQTGPPPTVAPSGQSTEAPDGSLGATAGPTEPAPTQRPELAPTVTPPAPTPGEAATVSPRDTSNNLPTPAAPEWDDLSVYAAAMRPEFAADLQPMAEATRYHIALTVSSEMDSIEGRQLVHYTNREAEPLSEVYFRLFANLPAMGGEMRLTALRINGEVAKPVYELDESALRIPLPAPLEPGQSVDFDLSFQTTLPSRSPEEGYNQFGFYDDVLALPHFYPQIPVYDAEEGWNVEIPVSYGDLVFSDSSLYQVTIRAPADQQVVASGSCQAAEPEADVRDWHCVSGPMRDFALMMSAEYEVLSEQIGDLVINSYFLPQHADTGRKGLGYTIDAVESFQRRIGPYPFGELDVVETPTTAGGIEYPGLIVVAAGLYERDDPFHEYATAHEVAHQWWYSLVGTDQIDRPWLDESLTQYTTILYYEDTYDEDRAIRVRRGSLEASYAQMQRSERDMRGDQPVEAYDEAQYSGIIYGKTPLFFHALREEMGDEAFNAFLRSYFEAHRYGVATEADLIEAAQAHLDSETVDQLLEEWVRTP